jgi:hypothetical protein
MKYKVMLFILLIIPAIISGFNLRIPENVKNTMSGLYSPNIQNNHYMPSLPALSSDRDRAWSLESLSCLIDPSATGVLTANENYVYFYNDELQTRVDSIQVFFWDDGTLSWAYIYTRKLIYEPLGEYIIQQQFKHWNDPISFINMNCYYDAQNRLTDFYQYNYNQDLRDYELTQRVNFEYGTNCLNEMVTIMPSSGRSYYEKYTFDNDEYGRITTAYGYAGPDSVNWGQLSIEELCYMPEDTSTGPEYISYLSHYVLIDEDWEDGFYGKLEYKESFFEYNGVGWNDFYHDIYTYNASGQLIEILDQYMQVTFQNVSRYTFTYDAENNLYSRTAQDWVAAPRSWETPKEELVYVWVQTTQNEDNVMPSAARILSAYPNPFRDGVNIKLDSKSNAPVMTCIYNIKGQHVKSVNGISQSITWDAKDTDNETVSPGVYVIKAVQDGQSVSKKIIKLN